MGALIMTQHHNDDARMSELYAERAAGGEHEIYGDRSQDWMLHPEDHPFHRHIKYRLKQPKPKELEVWVGNCSMHGIKISDKPLESSRKNSGILWVRGDAAGLFQLPVDIPVGQQRKYKLVPVEDGDVNWQLE